MLRILLILQITAGRHCAGLHRLRWGMLLPCVVRHRRCTRQAMPLVLDATFVLNASQPFVSNVFSEFVFVPTVIVPMLLLIPMTPTMLKFSVMNALMFWADMAWIFGRYAQD